MIVLCPSRGRPKRALEMAISARLTASDPIDVLVVIDDTETMFDEYRESVPWLHVLVGRHRYTEALNAAAMSSMGRDHGILAAFGDDVIFRTEGWDRRVRETLATPGIAYADDLVHGAAHPTGVFMSREVVDALGWLALPNTMHQWADDAWKRLGQETGCLRFMEGVVIEHMHPAVGKAAWDDGYRSLLDTTDPMVTARASRDYEGFRAWERDGLEADVARVRAVL